MKKNNGKKIVVFQFLMLAFFCVRCPAIQDEIGNPTVPPSSVRSGLVKSPTQTANSGNLIVTGNVSGMSYFHGLVPYQTPTYFGGPLGSSDISSFLRLTAPVSSPASPRYLPQPYYLPSRTVSSTAQSALGTVLTYPSIRASGGTGEFTAPQKPLIEKQPEIPGISPLYDYSRTRPLSYEPTEIEEKLIAYDSAREKTKKELSQALQKAAEETYKLPAQVQQPNEPVKPFKPLQPGEIPNTQIQSADKDIYEQMLAELKKTQQPQEVSQPAEQNQPQKESPSELRSKWAVIEKETAETTVGVHKSFATQAKDKFNYYMRTAEEFLKQGKYYRAVDAYMLACIYKPDDPLAYAGRAHALFASGEYMSSAYFLAVAINIFPQYVDFKIDLNAMLPDANQLESRIADVKQLAQKPQAPELNFLLAYLYYQQDKNDLALEAIKTAAEKMPKNAAVKILQQAIEKNPK